MSNTRLTVLLPPGYDCVAVYPHCHEALDCFAVPLHSPNGKLLAVSAAQVTVNGRWKTLGIRTSNMSPWGIAVYPDCSGHVGIPSPNLVWAIMQMMTMISQSEAMPYPIDSPTANRFGLCISLLRHWPAYLAGIPSHLTVTMLIPGAGVRCYLSHHLSGVWDFHGW